MIASHLTKALLLSVAVQAILANPLPTYSVVDVDGGNNGHNLNGAAATTIYKTITATEAAPTVTVTMTATASMASAPATVTLTKTSISTVYLQAAISSVPVAISDLRTVSQSIVEVSTLPASTTTITTSVLVEGPAATSTTYYDNGLWHTSYPIKLSTTTSSESTISSMLPVSSGYVARRQTRRGRA